MSIKLLVNLRQDGDTIVEVLIAITIVSLVLGGAYVTSNNSLKANRDAQEHGQAVALLQSEIEQLRSLVANSGGSGGQPFNFAGPFCIDNSEQVVAANSASCVMNSDGMPTTSQPEYTVSANRNGDTFTFTTSWPSIINAQTDQETMYYRIYP